jgi:hypothetical protein
MVVTQEVGIHILHRFADHVLLIGKSGGKGLRIKVIGSEFRKKTGNVGKSDSPVGHVLD